MAGDQGDESLSAAPADTKGEVAQPGTWSIRRAMPIHGPAAALQIGLEGGHHGIEAGVKDGAAIHVHDLVAATAVVAGSQPALPVPFQGNHGAVAIGQFLWSREEWLHHGRQLANPLKGFHHHLPFPVLLGFGFQALEGAATTVIRKDARGFPAIRGGLEQAHQLGDCMAFGLMHQAHLNAIPWKGPFHKNHLAVYPTHPQPLTGEVIHREGVKAPVQPLSLLHRSS
jgi:hypothetical protein